MPIVAQNLQSDTVTPLFVVGDIRDTRARLTKALCSSTIFVGCVKVNSRLLYPTLWAYFAKLELNLDLATSPTLIRTVVILMNL